MKRPKNCTCISSDDHNFIVISDKRTSTYCYAGAEFYNKLLLLRIKGETKRVCCEVLYT